MSLVFITLTNTGYVNYTLNCLKSLDKINFDTKLVSYCIGKTGYDILTREGYPCKLIDEESNSNFQTFRNGNWSNITYNKFKIIYENLLEYKYVCITDGDIVFENPDFMQYLLDKIKDNDMLTQNDGIDDNDTANLCSGFMFIQSTPKTLNFFNPEEMSIYKDIIGWDDQVYVNNIKNNLKFKTLPFDLFPTGAYYYKNHSSINPYMIHFNWVVGHEKERRMRYYGKWYI